MISARCNWRFNCVQTAAAVVLVLLAMLCILHPMHGGCNTVLQPEQQQAPHAAVLSADGPRTVLSNNPILSQPRLEEFSLPEGYITRRLRLWRNDITAMLRPAEQEGFALQGPIPLNRQNNILYMLRHLGSSGACKPGADGLPRAGVLDVGQTQAWWECLRPRLGVWP